MKTTRPILPTPATALTTPRLLLRPFQLSDVVDLHALRTQPDVMVWTSSGKTDVDQDETVVWMNRFRPPNDATTYCFVIEELGVPGRVIGTIGCHQFEPPEVGYLFRREAWGKGYATEALHCWLQAWWALPRKEVDVPQAGFGGLGTEGVLREVLKADTVITNHGSRKVLERSGFIIVSEEMVVDHGNVGEKIKLITLELQRPEQML